MAYSLIGARNIFPYGPTVEPSPSVRRLPSAYDRAGFSAWAILEPTLVASYLGAIRDSPEIWLGISRNPSRQRARAVLLLANAPHSGATFLRDGGEVGVLA
jgi:hypothetical protein